MIHYQTLAILTTTLLSSPGELPKVVQVVRNAYEENVTALSSFGTIRFHVTDGELGRATGADEIRDLLKSDWKRRSPSHGLFVFDGQKRRYENLYPPEELVARRVKLSDSSWRSFIATVRLLSDGETTLMDRVEVDIKDDKTVLHTPGCYKGTGWLFSIGGQFIPLRLNDPEPPRASLGRCLRELAEGREGVRLVETDESALLGDVGVIKLRFELSNPRTEVTFWVDLEHGAVPIQTRAVEDVRDHRTLGVEQENLTDLRPVARGWLPFRMTYAIGQASRAGASGEPPSGGALPGLLVRETVVDEANFEGRPEPAMFALEFPEEVSVIDSDRLLAYGRRRVWTLGDFSPARQAKARRIKLKSPLPVQAPAMPGPRQSLGWWPACLAALGLACLLGAVAFLLNKRRRHAN